MEPAAWFGSRIWQPGLKIEDAQIVLSKLTKLTAYGKVVLVSNLPFEISFVEKAMNAQNAGATAVIIYDNEDALFYVPFNRWHYGAHKMAAAITIPVVGITQEDGTQLAAAIKAGRTTISLHGTCFFSQVAACYCHPSALILL
eukprot:SAG11_NODE_11_length_27870_cov_16.327428_2_plen_143_part_00